MLTPCGAAWSVDAWLRRRKDRVRGPVYIYPWALRLLFVQMMLIYFCNGLYKATGGDWRSGNSLYYVLGDLTLARWSYAQIRVPYWLTKLASWMVLVWEVGFPLWVGLPWKWFADLYDGTRLVWLRLALRPLRHIPVVALSFGVAFHLGIWAAMELGCFVPYMLCLYLPLLPAERLARRRAKSVT
jgi:hypothetical protein